MIVQPSVREVFKYEFHPCMDSFRDHQNDNGFRVVLSSDGLLVIDRFLRDGTHAMEKFYVNPQLIYDYSQLLSANNWLYDLPHNFLLPNNVQVRFWSYLEMDGLVPFRIEDLPRLTHLPLGDSMGRPARRLMVFFEDLMDLLQHYGLSLDVHHLMVNYSVLTPLTDTQMNDNWMNTVS